MTEQPTDGAASGAPETGSTKDPLRSSRTSRFWAALVALIVLVVFLVVFVAQNTERVSVSFLGWDWRAPLAVAMLIAVAAGLAIGAAAGTLRIWQLHRRVKRAS